MIIWYGGGRVLVGALTIGAGKTSLISLISRFYDIQKGAILVDGIDVRNVRQKDLRKHVGAVLQDPFIFSGTITSNTRLHEEHISKLMLNRTSIIIAHRLSTIRNVDRIIVMHKGRIVEQGTHEQLLGQQGVYRRLYDFQYAQ